MSATSKHVCWKDASENLSPHSYMQADNIPLDSSQNKKIKKKINK